MIYNIVIKFSIFVGKETVEFIGNPLVKKYEESKAPMVLEVHADEVIVHSGGYLRSTHTY